MASTNLVAQKRTVHESLEKARTRIEALLPKGTTYDAVMQDIYIASRKPGGERIFECDPESVVTAVVTIQQWGLQIGRTAYLVPFGNQCNAVAGYTGLIELVIASGYVRSVTAYAVYANDRFKYELGSSPFIEHQPVWEGGPRGALIGAYAIARLAHYQFVICYMRLEEIEVIRKTSKQWPPSKIPECPEWYAIKTAVRRLCKTLPQNPKLALVMRVINQSDAGEVERVPAAEFTIETPDTPPSVDAEGTSATGTPADSNGGVEPGVAA